MVLGDPCERIICTPERGHDPQVDHCSRSHLFKFLPLSNSAMLKITLRGHINIFVLLWMKHRNKRRLMVPRISVHQWQGSHVKATRLTVVEARGRNCSRHDGPGRRESWEPGTSYNFPRCLLSQPSDLPSPSWAHFLKDSLPLETAPPAGEQMAKLWSCGGYSTFKP